MTSASALYVLSHSCFSYFSNTFLAISLALLEWKDDKAEAAKVASKRNAARADAGGMSQAEILELQQKLFQEARARAAGVVEGEGNPEQLQQQQQQQQQQE
jgi:hypothetical protein